MRIKLKDIKIKDIATSKNAKNEALTFKLKGILKILAIIFLYLNKTFSFLTLLRMYIYIMIEVYTKILWKPQRHY